jgi:hypothetical protein
MAGRKDREGLRKYHKEWRDKNSEHVKEYYRKKYADHREEKLETIRRSRANNPDVTREYSRKYKIINPEKKKAQEILNNAVRDGRVIRPDTCSCGRPRPDGHHEDYSKPLMVTWLCRKCHMELHRKMGDIPMDVPKAMTEEWK